MKVNIKKELEKNRLKTKTELYNINEYGMEYEKGLLEGDQQEIEFLKKAGLGKRLDDIENARTSNLERSILESKYESKVFTATEIRDVFLKYNLRFLASCCYEGAVDLQIGAKIKSLVQTHQIDVDTNKFYILAEPYAFTSCKQLPPKKVAPVLFYRLTNNIKSISNTRYHVLPEDVANNDKFLIVHNWDTTPRFSGMNMKTLMHQAILRAVLFIFILHVGVVIGGCIFNVKVGITDLLFSILIGSCLSLLTMWLKFLRGELDEV